MRESHTAVFCRLANCIADKRGLISECLLQKLFFLGRNADLHPFGSPLLFHLFSHFIDSFFSMLKGMGATLTIPSICKYFFLEKISSTFFLNIVWYCQ